MNKDKMLERKEQTNRRYNMDKDKKQFIKSFLKQSFDSYSVIELGLIEYYLKLDNYEMIRDLLYRNEDDFSNFLYNHYKDRYKNF